MKTIELSDLLSRLEGFDRWLIELGLTPVPYDRIHEALKVLRRAEHDVYYGQQTGQFRYIQPHDWFAIVEALEAHDILRAFQNDRSPALTAELKRALDGPKQPIREAQGKCDGRNIWFQLALGAQWRLGGASVFVEEPDLRLTRDGITFLVACKRPFSENSIQANLSSAFKQLERNLRDAPSDHFGVAAISLSRIFNPGDKVFPGGVDELAVLLKSQFANYERHLASIYKEDFCCVLFNIATPGSRGIGVDMVRESSTVLWDFGHPSRASKAFAEHIQAVHQSTGS